MKRTVDLVTEDLKKIPGYTTSIPPYEWKGKIEGLIHSLREDGMVKEHGWKTDEYGQDSLFLEIEVEVQDVHRRIQMKLEPVLIRYKKHTGGRGSPWTYEKKEALSWKLFHDYLERKIAAIRVGIVDIQHEFMQNIMKELPDGSIGTFAEFMDNILAEGQIQQLGLEERKEEKEVKEREEAVKPVDAEYKVIDEEEEEGGERKNE